MSPSLKAVLALVFVVGMGAVLIRPILNSTDVAPTASSEVEAPSPKRTKAEAPSPTPRPTPSPQPSATADGELISGPFRTQPLFDRYPASCLREASPPGEGPLIAAINRDRVSFGTTAGPVQPGPEGGASLGKVNALLGFDRTGNLYAARSRSGGVMLSPPEGLQAGDGDPGYGEISSISWSPISDCSVAIGEGGALVVLPSRGPDQLVSEGVVSAAFSPDGRRLALVLEEGKTTSVWVADLNGTNMREVQRGRTGPTISLQGWSPDGMTLYLTLGRDSGLSFVTVLKTSVPPQSGGVVAAPVTSLEQCGGRLLGVVNGAIATISTRGPDYLTDTDAGYTAVSCAPNGAFMAALRDDNLFLLDAEGRELRDLTTDSGFRDVYVDWGDAGTGLLFGRVPTGGGPAQVWHIAEGDAARNTGLVFTPAPGAIDWAASPPTGLPLP